MDERKGLNHAQWECNNHVILIPKYRWEALYKELRRYLREVFRRLAEQKESRVEEGHLMRDHVHMRIAIPPQYAVSQVIGYIKGKSFIHLARTYGEKEKILGNQQSWARGFFVSRVAEKKKSFGNTIAGKRRRTSAWIKWGFGKRPPRVAPERPGRVSDPEQPL